MEATGLEKAKLEQDKYEKCLKLTKAIEEIFHINGRSQSFMSVNGISGEWSIFHTDEGVRIFMQGNCMTREEVEEIKRDHVEGDVMSDLQSATSENSPEENEKLDNELEEGD